MYSNIKYYENICNCLRVIQQNININRKLKSANCWQQTSLNLHELTDFIIFLSKQPFTVFFLSFVNGRLFRAKHMTKCILIKICIDSFSISTKPLNLFLL